MHFLIHRAAWLLKISILQSLCDQFVSLSTMKRVKITPWPALVRMLLWLDGELLMNEVGIPRTLCKSSLCPFLKGINAMTSIRIAAESSILRVKCVRAAKPAKIVVLAIRDQPSCARKRCQMWGQDGGNYSALSALDLGSVELKVFQEFIHAFATIYPGFLIISEANKKLVF